MRSRIKKGLAYRRVAGELFVVDAAGSRLHELNAAAALIWDGLAAGKSDAALAASLAAEYEVDGATAAADCAAFIAELRGKGLLAE